MPEKNLQSGQTVNGPRYESVTFAKESKRAVTGRSRVSGFTRICGALSPYATPLPVQERCEKTSASTPFTGSQGVEVADPILRRIDRYGPRYTPYEGMRLFRV
jgi:hypothetical protein